MDFYCIDPRALQAAGATGIVSTTLSTASGDFPFQEDEWSVSRTKSSRREAEKCPLV